MQERIWRRIRYEATTNRWFETLDDVWDTVQRTTGAWTPESSGDFVTLLSTFVLDVGRGDAELTSGALQSPRDNGSCRMRKVAVFGNAGGGNSTLARQLAEVTQLPLYPLDTIQYKPGRS